MPVALGAALNSNNILGRSDFPKPGQAGERNAFAYCKLDGSFYKILELIVHWLLTAGGRTRQARRLEFLFPRSDDSAGLLDNIRLQCTFATSDKYTSDERAHAQAQIA